MDLITIITGLLPYVKYSMVFIIIMSIGYLVYKKFFFKKYPVRVATFVAIALLICWAIVVLGITTLSRPAFFTGQINVSLFSGYINAWNKWSVSELQLIIFNMIMFMPLGILLPLLHRKNRSFWRVLALSFGFTLCIEVFQLVSGKGIFELDDLLHNTIGSLAGYFLMMAFIVMLEKRKLKLAPIAKALSIPLFFAALFGIATIVYQAQEFGNLPFKPAQKQSMERIEVQLETALSDKEAEACIYYNEDVGNLKEAQRTAQFIAEQFNLQQQGGMRREGDNRVLSFLDDQGISYRFTYFMQDGSWQWYADYSNEQPLTLNVAQQRQLIEGWLKKEDLLPTGAVYQQQDERTIRWDLAEAEDLQTACEDFTAGMIIASLSNLQAPADIIYQMNDHKMVTKKPTISEQEAFEALADGEFSLYNSLEKGDTLTITDVQLDYVYDTKGYYQPVY
ncbi:MAG: VanZ family protein, partial [Lysinibacillus sp.]